MAFRRLGLLVLLISIVVAVTFAASTPSIVSSRTMLAAPMKAVSLKSRLRYKITTLLQNRAINSTKTMRQKYPYISADGFLKRPIITLGLNMNIHSINCKKYLDNDKLGLLHAQFATFQGPINLTYQYELNQGQQNTDLAESIRVTKYVLDDTVNDIFKVFPKNQKIPSGKQVNETEMDSRTREYLKRVQNMMGGPPIVANVKSFRNYVILYTLNDIIPHITSCIPGN